MSDLTVRIVPDLDHVDAGAWDRLDHGHAPFLRYGFLRALEQSGSIGRDAGWLPVFILVEQASQSGEGADPPTPSSAPEHASASSPSAAPAQPEVGTDPPTRADAPTTASPQAAAATTGADEPKPGKLLAGVAAFIKPHSYGEYIFDWSWARASERAGLPYYPKLVIAAPVTPATGPRMLIADDLPIPRKTIIDILCGAVRTLADRAQCNSIHWLFCTQAEQRELADRGFYPRSSFQFHWQNRGYQTFDDFLAKLTSRRRKQIRKERRRALAAVDGPVEFVRGDAVSAADIELMDQLYRETTWAHGGQDYLKPGFFAKLCATMPDQVRIARVCQDGQMVAGALYLQTERALYGRYWGSAVEVDCLHFEVAYYAGVEHCIREGLQLFEAGAQGEHKLLRGFAPSPTYSNHWIRYRGLREAVERFMQAEALDLQSYTARLDELCPYKQES